LVTPKTQQKAWWKNLDRLVKWLESVGIPYRDWIKAQFDEWPLNVGTRYPHVTQLGTTAAYYRYVTWVRKRDALAARGDSVLQEPQTPFEEFQLEVESGAWKLKQIKGRVDPQVMVKTMPGIFPPSFWLVWPQVRAMARRRELPAIVQTRWDFAQRDVRAEPFLDQVYGELFGEQAA